MLHQDLIRYELIGSQPAVANIDLETSIREYKAERLGSVKSARGAALVRAAEHFFGLSLADFGSMLELVDAMEAMNQDTMVH